MRFNTFLRLALISTAATFTAPANSKHVIEEYGSSGALQDVLGAPAPCVSLAISNDAQKVIDVVSSLTEKVKKTILSAKGISNSVDFVIFLSIFEDHIQDFRNSIKAFDGRKRFEDRDDQDAVVKILNTWQETEKKLINALIEKKDLAGREDAQKFAPRLRASAGGSMLLLSNIWLPFYKDTILNWSNNLRDRYSDLADSYAKGSSL